MMKYDGLTKPEEKATIEVETDPVHIVRSAYSLWMQFVERPVYDLRDDKLYDSLREEAIRLLAPYEKLPMEITDKAYFTVINDFHGKAFWFSGIFYTALAELGNRHLVVPKDIPSVKLFGYKMSRGKLDILASAEQIGKYSSGGHITFSGHYTNTVCDNATGGTFVNKGNVGTFSRAKNCTFINHEHVNRVAGYIENCIFENYGHVDDIYNYCGENSVFINHNYVAGMGGHGTFANFGMVAYFGAHSREHALNLNFGIVTEIFGGKTNSGTFIAAHPPDPLFHFGDDAIRIIPQAYLAKDKHLGKLVEEMRESLQIPDKTRINTLSERIQDYCKQHCNWKDYLKAVWKQ